MKAQEKRLSFLEDESGIMLIEAAISIPTGILTFTGVAEVISACVTLFLVEWSASMATERHLAGASPPVIAEEVHARINSVLPTRRADVTADDGQIAVAYRLALLPISGRVITFRARYAP